MCVYECPVGAISIIENVSTKIDEEKCLGCGRCFKNCQTGAIVKAEGE
jgi:Fe-S-cluster-containing hydrogenase component 2